MAPGDEDDDDQSMGTTGEIRRDDGPSSVELAEQQAREQERLIEAAREAERQRRDRDE